MSKPHPEDEAVRALSPAGIVQREAILAHLLDDLRRVYVRRRTRRRVALTAAPALLVALALFAALRMLAPSPSPQTAGRSDGAAGAGPQIPDQPGAIIMVVRTDSGTTGSNAADITLLNDDELLDTLAEMNRPTGLVRTGERVWLTSTVADNAPRNGSSL